MLLNAKEVILGYGDMWPLLQQHDKLCPAHGPPPARPPAPSPLRLCARPISIWGQAVFSSHWMDFWPSSTPARPRAVKRPCLTALLLGCRWLSTWRRWLRTLKKTITSISASSLRLILRVMVWKTYTRRYVLCCNPCLPYCICFCIRFCLCLSAFASASWSLHACVRHRPRPT